MNEQGQGPNDESYDEEAALAAARRAVDAVFAESPEAQMTTAVDATFTPEVTMRAAGGALYDVAEQASRHDEGTVAGQLPNMPADTDFAASRQEYMRQAQQLPQPPIGPADPGQIVSGRHENVSQLQ